MTNPRRYNLSPGTLAGVVAHPEGSFVHWSDYEQLRKELTTVAKAGGAAFAELHAHAEPVPDCPKCGVAHYPNCERK